MNIYSVTSTLRSKPF